jgi:hypothetical protein
MALGRGPEAQAGKAGLGTGRHRAAGCSGLQRAAAAGAVEALVQVIGSSQDPGVLQQAACALANTCGGDSADIEQRAVDAGAVEALVQVIGSSQDAGVLQQAAAARANICSGDSAAIEQRAAGAGAGAAGAGAAGAGPGGSAAACRAVAGRPCAHGAGRYARAAQAEQQHPAWWLAGAGQGQVLWWRWPRPRAGPVRNAPPARRLVFLVLAAFAQTCTTKGTAASAAAAGPLRRLAQLQAQGG